MRATDLHRFEWELRHCGIRLVDVLAAALGYGLLYTIAIALLIGLVDWLQGNPQTVMPQLVALLEWIDGGVR